MSQHQTGMPDLAGIPMAELSRRRRQLPPVLARAVGELDRGEVLVSRFQSAMAEPEEDAYEASLLDLSTTTLGELLQHPGISPVLARIVSDLDRGGEQVSRFTSAIDTHEEDA